MNSDDVMAIIRSSDLTPPEGIGLVCTQYAADPAFWFAYPGTPNTLDEGGTSYVVHTPTSRVFEYSSSVPPRQRILRAKAALSE